MAFLTELLTAFNNLATKSVTNVDKLAELLELQYNAGTMQAVAFLVWKPSGLGFTLSFWFPSNNGDCIGGTLHQFDRLKVTANKGRPVVLLIGLQHNVSDTFLMP